MSNLFVSAFALPGIEEELEGVNGGLNGFKLKFGEIASLLDIGLQWCTSPHEIGYEPFTIEIIRTAHPVSV
ncbi:hypothetical protein W02_22270 [Nitrospira sp. KM1]|nr:hypothetical protein W02_22270 [Nitrospira sp. KM1]